MKKYIQYHGVSLAISYTFICKRIYIHIYIIPDKSPVLGPSPIYSAGNAGSSP